MTVIDGNPVGPYKADGRTNFMIIKVDPETQNHRPGGYIEEGHPYIKEISDKLDQLFKVLYEIDYKTLTDDRHKEILKGELAEDSEYLKINKAISDQVITEVTSTSINSIDFQVGMDQARVSSEITYDVIQSSEQLSVWNKYLEGKTFVASAISEMERIDDEWEVTHVIEMTVRALEDN